MRKLWTAALVAVMMLSATATTAGAEDYRTRALEHLRAKYGSQEITLHEGGLTQLELTGESFWMAKYGGSSPAVPADEDNKPAPPNQTTPGQESPKGTVMPSPPEGNIPPAPEVIGLIAIRLATGEVLDGVQMEKFYQAEQTAWELLAAEAGKIEVSLYRKLRDLSKEVRLSVVLQPSAKITPELRAKIAELRAKYPLFAANLSLSDEQLLGGGAMASDMPATNKAEPAIAIEPNRLAPRLSPEQEKAYRLQAEAFFAAIGTLRMEAILESAKTIETTLADMRVTHEVDTNGQFVKAELTAEEIRSMAAVNAVSAVYEHAITLPATSFGREPAPGTTLKTSDAAIRQSTEASVVSAVPAGYQLAGGALVVTSLLFGALALVRRRLKRD